MWENLFYMYKNQSFGRKMGKKHTTFNENVYRTPF